MKKKIVITLFLFCWQTMLAQGFINLDFENAIIVPDASSGYYPYAVYANYAIPGWTATGSFLGTNEVFYNDISLGASSVSLVGTNDTFGPKSLDGAYSIDLFGGTTGVSISQTGVVPVNAASILFIAQGNLTYGGPLLVSLGGQNIPFSAVSIGANYTLYGGNIPLALAGQNVQLIFQALEGGNNYWEIDDIQFSPTAVPEPNEFALAALGALLIGIRLRTNRK